jgi:hypothetical protein
MHDAVGAHPPESEHAASVTAKARAMDARKCHLVEKGPGDGRIRLTRALRPRSRLLMRNCGIPQPRTVTPGIQSAEPSGFSGLQGLMSFFFRAHRSV